MRATVKNGKVHCLYYDNYNMLFTGNRMEIKDIKQLALDLSSHSCPSSNLFFSKNRASAKKLLVELHSPWCVGMWSRGQ